MQGQGHKRQLHYDLSCAEIEAILTLLRALGTFHYSRSHPFTVPSVALYSCGPASKQLSSILSPTLLGCCYPGRSLLCPTHVCVDRGWPIWFSSTLHVSKELFPYPEHLWPSLLPSHHSIPMEPFARYTLTLAVQMLSSGSGS